MHHVRGALLLACSPCRLTRHADDFPLGENFGDLEKDGRQRVSTSERVLPSRALAGHSAAANPSVRPDNS